MKNFNKNFRALGYRTPNWFLRGLKNNRLKNRKVVDLINNSKKKKDEKAS